MTKRASDTMQESLLTRWALTVKSVAKLILSTHKARYEHVARTSPLIILGNGPSLKENIANDLEQLQSVDTMAVNFAANAPEFTSLRPKYYILADPHFFNNQNDPNVSRLLENIAGVGWQMTLFLPFAARKHCTLQPTDNLKIEYYNAVGVEGCRWLTDFAYQRRRAMPRPRNVLIPAIMTGIGLGYKEVYLLGADHSWTKTLDVDEENHVVSVQPHFYKEDNREVERITRAYHQYPLHSVLYSMCVAFRAYHQIADFAARRDIKVYNATPGSLIDAFERRPLP